MPNVLSLVPHLEGDTGIDRYEAMMDRKLAQQGLGRQTAQELRDTSAIVRSGNYAAVLDEGVRKIVLVLTYQANLVDGKVTVSKFTETDHPPSYLKRVTKSNLLQDLGEYTEFTQRHEPLWKLAMSSRHSPDAGLSMVQALDHLVRAGVAATQEAVDVALKTFRAPDPEDLLEQQRAKLDALLVQGISGQ